MVSSAGDSDSRFSIAKVKAVYAKMLPSINRHARIAFRSYSPDAKEEAVQNVLCNTWAALVGLARRGKLDQAFPSVLANFAERQTRDHRITGGHLDVKDVLGHYCQVNKGVTVERLDHFDDEENAWTEAVVEDTRTAPVPDIVAFRVDFADWLKSLRRRDRRIAEALSVGHTTSHVARKFRVSAGRISQLRKELAENWRKFVGDEPGGANAA
ncbi:MAG: hypothetical protein ACLP9L_16040 [Thermoguttaceae bacterium]